MKLPLYLVDAFTSKVFGGNTAAVCPLAEWLDDELLMKIANQNGFSETAFYVASENNYHLRWFTPEMEVDLCGHATLATAFVLTNLYKVNGERIIFNTKSGQVSVSKTGNVLTLDFPARDLLQVGSVPHLQDILGYAPKNVAVAGKTVIVELEDQSAVLSFLPNFTEIRKLDYKSLIITAPGDQCDFVSRFFAPKVGIDEDPVTGSAHCGLIPYWAEKLGKNVLLAQQVSKRGGTLFCEYLGERVLIGGHASLYCRGEIYI